MMFTGRLNGSQVLLIRPEQSAKDLQQLLSAAGADVFHFPVMKILFEDLGGFEQHLAAVETIDKVIFVSRNAVIGAAAWLDTFKESPDFSAAYFAVGAATAKCLQASGISGITPNLDMTSEGLLALADLMNVSGKKIAIFSGQGGRTLLVDELTLRGAEVIECNVYRRVFEDSFSVEINTFVQAAKTAVILLHSAELMNSLLKIIAQPQLQKLFATAVIVPSVRLQQLAKNAGFKKIVTARNAAPESMVSATFEWYSSLGTYD